MQVQRRPGQEAAILEDSHQAVLFQNKQPAVSPGGLMPYSGADIPVATGFNCTAILPRRMGVSGAASAPEPSESVNKAGKIFVGFMIHLPEKCPAEEVKRHLRV